jgi:hypothetical protein
VFLPFGTKSEAQMMDFHEVEDLNKTVGFIMDLFSALRSS